MVTRSGRIPKLLTLHARSTGGAVANPRQWDGGSPSSLSFRSSSSPVPHAALNKPRRSSPASWRCCRVVFALYLAGAQEILRLARTIGPRVPHLMIIGHNPGISELSNLLAPNADVGGLATAAFCTLTFDTDQWSAVGPKIVREVTNEAPPSRLFSLFA
jgi:hypothetical protein